MSLGFWMSAGKEQCGHLARTIGAGGAGGVGGAQVAWGGIGRAGLNLGHPQPHGRSSLGPEGIWRAACILPGRPRPGALSEGKLILA